MLRQIHISKTHIPNFHSGKLINLQLIVFRASAERKYQAAGESFKKQQYSQSWGVNFSAHWSKNMSAREKWGRFVTTHQQITILKDDSWLALNILLRKPTWYSSHFLLTRRTRRYLWCESDVTMTSAARKCVGSYGTGFQQWLTEKWWFQPQKLCG